MNEKETTQLRNTVRDFLNAHRKAVFAFLDVKGYPTASLHTLFVGLTRRVEH